METKTIDNTREFNPGDDIIVVSDHRTPGRNMNFPLSSRDKVTIESVFVESTGHVHLNIGKILPTGEPSLSSLDTAQPLGGSFIYWMHPSSFKHV